MQAAAALPTPVLRFLGSLNCLKQTGEGKWRALCPAHQPENWQGRDTTLAIAIGDRCLLLKCFAGCDFETVVKAAGFRPLDLAWEPQKLQGKWEPLDGRRVVQTYDYRDEQGTLLYRVLRYEPKGFSQEWLDTTRKKWIPGLDLKVRRVLYRLPELAAEPGRWAVVVEGEKDADALAALGFLSTCNPGGTGMGWRDAYSLSLRGRAVCVVPDSDSPGLRHADAVCGSLLRCGVRRLRLALLPQGVKDVSEFLGRQEGDPAAAVRQLLNVTEWGPKGV